MDNTNDAIMFCITKEDQQKINTWIKDVVNPSGIEIQKATFLPTHPDYENFRSCWELGYAYSGAIGGSLSYIFIPTSLGIILNVKDSLTGLELDVTDYNEW